MGRRGPAPKPTAIKILEGNPGKQKLNHNEPKPPTIIAIPKPPSRLLKDAKAGMAATGSCPDCHGCSYGR